MRLEVVKLRYGVKTALLDCVILVLILALFSLVGCGGGGGSAVGTGTGTGEQAQSPQVEQVEQEVQTEQTVQAEEAVADPSEVATVAVPAVVGLSLEEASTVLSGLGFQVSSGEDYSEKTTVGGICDQKPVGGSSAPRGSSVFIVVSLGTAWVACPTCKGKGAVFEQYTCPECGGSGLCDT